MPKQELQELREFIREKSETIPGLSISGMIRKGLTYQMDMIERDSDEFQEAYQATRLFEMVTDLFRKEFLWKKTE